MPDAASPPTRHAPIYQPTEIIQIEGRVVACDGGNGVLGHPRVWLRVPDGVDRTLCPYCSRLYVATSGRGGQADGH